MTGSAFRDFVLLAVGNIFLVILAIKAMGAWAQDNYGAFWGLVIGAVVLAGLIYFPEQVVGLLKRLWTMFFGGQAGAAPAPLTGHDALALAGRALIGA